MRSCLAPRALRNCAPSAPWGASVRPLNFTVRRRSTAGSRSVPKFNPIARPPGVTALGAFFAFGALAGSLSSASLLTPGGALEPMWRPNPRAHAGFVSLHLWGPILMGGLALVCAATALGLIRGKVWGYRLAIALLLINFVGDFANAALGVERRAIIGLPVAGLLLWYLFSRRVRAYFSPAVNAA
jgi:hypothetical protein